MEPPAPFKEMHYFNTFSFKIIFFFHIQNKGYISLCCGDHSALFGVATVQTNQLGYLA